MRCKALLLILPLFLVNALNTSGQIKKECTDTLVVLWSSGDRDVAEKSCLMYTHASKTQAWFDEVILIIWGPSAKLVIDDEDIRNKVIQMHKDGVILEACIACSNMFSVTEELIELGVDVKGMGVPLSTYLKKGYHILSY